ncbi:sensor histidine kinase [Laceyella putida]|uniref:Sensor histidine kinase n=1 Tax=Laceyella putida TaxID=110101 RepID=A0ABW2RLZ7_9BACL
MKAYTLKGKLTIFYGLTILIPIVIISIIMPYTFQYLIEKETQTLTETTLQTLSHNIEMYLDDLERITIIPYFNDPLMRALQLKVFGYDEADLSTEVFVERTLANSLSTYFHNLRADIVGTIILPADGSVYVTTNGISKSIDDFPYKNQEWYRKAIAANGKAIFISAHAQDYLDNPPADEVFSVARLIKDPESLRPLGVIIADADTSALKRMMGNIQFNVASKRAIFNENGELFYASSPVSDEMIKQIKDKKTTIQDEHDSYVVVSQEIQPANWKIVVLLSKSELNAKLKWMFLAGIMFAIGGLVLTYLLFSALSKWIVNPFQHAIRVMKRVQHGDLQVRLETRGNDEIAQLGHSFNLMIEKINELIDREYKAVLNQRNAEYRALQSQIQPHFIFNTLNGFIALNRMGDRKTLEHAILSLGSMLRYILDKEEWTTIKDAFRFIEQYCGLQRLRFQDRMEVEIHYGEVLGNCRILKLLLQPLIENAIIHGIEPSDNPCKLVISATIKEIGDEPYLVINIHDNGVGFDANNMTNNRSIGISNVRERLMITYPESTFSIESKEGSGTSVTIQIPEKDVRA